MCGISGFKFFGMGKENNFNNEKKLVEITNEISHRGPDSEGYWNSERDRIYIGHRRLSIIDLSIKGKQPMQSNDRRFVISFNGEIYNYKILRQKLKKKYNVLFKNNTDTQVILEYVSMFGIKKTLESLEGMFALAIWDKKEKKLTLARDRFGEKPLFYFLDSEQLVFSSELKVIKKFFAHQSLKINYKASKYYSWLGYIPAPMTIYENVHKVLPSEYVEISYGLIKKKKYWNLLNNYFQVNNDLTKKGLKQNLEEVELVLENSVKKMMLADVEVGCFLSGGIDSSLIASLMQKNSKKKIKTYTVGFSETAFDESIYAKHISRYLGTDHNEIIVSINDLIENINKIIDIYDEPFADSSCLPTELICKFASRDLKVILSGDGGDEIFLGYNRYLFAKKIKSFHSYLPRSLRIMIQSILNTFPSVFYDFISIPFQKSFGLQGFSHKVMKLSNILDYKDNNIFYKKLNIMDNNEIKNFSDNDPEYFQRYNELELIQSLQCNDIEYYLPNDILTKVDRASMFNSLEVRSPFLDHILVDKVSSFSVQTKMNNNSLKYLLKKILSKYIPPKLFLRPKMGFAIPVDSWLKQKKMRAFCDDIFYNVNWELVGYEDKKIKNIWSNYKKYKNAPGAKIWLYLIAGLWVEKIKL